MKKVSDFVASNRAPSESDEQLFRMQRNQYLKNKGIKLNSQFQLDIFEVISDRNDLRHIPNDYARSSLFTVRNKRVPRKNLIQENLYHYNEFVSIRYTGSELRAEDDELIWLQILNYGKSVPLGEPFEFAIKDLVHDVSWPKSGPNYDRARICISRLKATEILALNTKAYGTSGAISLIQSYTTLNDLNGKATLYRVAIDPNLVILFAGNTFTSHKWLKYRELSPIARRLADYIESHQFPYPLNLERFKEICGSSNTNTSSWRQKVKKACKEVLDANIIHTAFLAKDDKICFAPKANSPKSSDTIKD